MALERLPPNHRRCRSLVWVVPLKFDAVFMRFELALPATRVSHGRATPIHLQFAIYEGFDSELAEKLAGDACCYPANSAEQTMEPVWTYVAVTL